MANHETNVDPWVDNRLEALAPANEWTPNTAGAWSRFQERRRQKRVVFLRWAGASLAASLGSLALFLLPTSRACAQQPAVCTQHVLATVLRNRAAVPVTCEIFIDYQCPPCAKFLTETVPILEEQYVQTGKIRLLYRNFPQPQHRFAKLAALYVNAAGQLGYADRARNQIVNTQDVWTETGDIDAQIASALPPEIMPKLRDLVNQNQKLNASIDTDLAAAQEDHLTQAPSVVIVYKGNRQVMPPGVTIDQLKRYLDQPVPY